MLLSSSTRSMRFFISIDYFINHGGTEVIEFYNTLPMCIIIPSRLETLTNPFYVAYSLPSYFRRGWGWSCSI